MCAFLPYRVPTGKGSKRSGADPPAQGAIGCETSDVNQNSGEGIARTSIVTSLRLSCSVVPTGPNRSRTIANTLAGRRPELNGPWARIGGLRVAIRGRQPDCDHHHSIRLRSMLSG